MMVSLVGVAMTLATASASASEFLQPFDTTEPSESLFQRNSELTTLAPIVNVDTTLVGSTAMPTNKWWSNLIYTTAADKDTVSSPAWSNPYAVKLPLKSPFGLQACYSYDYRTEADLVDDKIRYYLHSFINDITLSAAEFTAKPDYAIYNWSDFGAALRICTTGTAQQQQSNGGACMYSSLVNGMAFISARYDGGLTPVIATDHAVTSFEQKTDGKYVASLNNGQTWVVYTSPATTLIVDSTGKAIAGSAGYTGMIRVALLPDSAKPDVYDAYAPCVVQGGYVSVQSRTKYSFNWQVNGSSCTNGLLHFAFQHQLDSMDGEGTTANSTGAIVLNSTVRGAMVGQITTPKYDSSTEIMWDLCEPEFEGDIGFYPPRSPLAGSVETYKIKETLEADIAADWDMNKGSLYYNGKAYQKYASLCLMAADADVMGSNSSTLLTTCIQKLQTMITPFLTNTFAPVLAYDSAYRGVVSNQVFWTGDVNVDFGNGVYNDHHYHYGYWVTASAMLTYLDPTWSGLKQLETMVWTLLRDVANPSQEDEYFTTFRHFSWFLGHSYSHGITPMADGKDEESSSEDINFYYGMMLWGQVTGRSAVQDLGSLMMRIDARAVRTYFLMKSDNALHPIEFVRNHVTGIFFDNKVDYTTWFSAEKYCIHGIQMIPVSPINEVVRTKEFVQQEWDDILAKESIVTAGDTTNAWMSLLYVNRAVLAQDEALQMLAKVSMDDGLSRSWALYIAATRAA